MGLYPRPIGNACGADRLNSYTIGADGRLYRCWADIGIEEKTVGNILASSSNVFNDNLYFNYMLFDPTTDTMCSDCNLLPICMGSCPYRRLLGDDDNCTRHKFMLEEYLGYISNKLKSQINSEDNLKTG